jgi:hypothetical protein
MSNIEKWLDTERKGSFVGDYRDTIVFKPLSFRRAIIKIKEKAFFSDKKEIWLGALDCYLAIFQYYNGIDFVRDIHEILKNTIIHRVQNNARIRHIIEDFFRNEYNEED